MTIEKNIIVLWLLFFSWVVGFLGGCNGDSSPSILDDIRFEAEFDSGNMDEAKHFSFNRYFVRPRPDYGSESDGVSPKAASWNGRTWWYHFSVTVPERYLPYAIELAIDTSRAWGKRIYSAEKVPVISCDGKNWRFVDSWTSWGEVVYGTQFPVISDTLTCPTTYVAMATPYPWAQLETFIASVDSSPYILRHATIGNTPEGENGDALPLYYLLLSDPDVQTAKRNVVVISGEHPGETVNSWMATGLIEYLLSDDARAASLRATFAFHIYPAINPKGLKYGHFRRPADTPLNPSRTWATDAVPEVSIVRDHMLSETKGRADYFFDLHGDVLSNHYIYYDIDNPAALKFVKAVAARHPNATVLQREVSSMVARKWAQQHLFSHGDEMKPALCFTPEGSYAQGSWEGTPDQVEDWKAMGAALVQAIGDVEGIE